MKVVIVRYNAGNTVSVRNALWRLGVEAVVSDDPEQIRSADRVLFPGVGEASSAMRFLRERGLDALLPDLTQPFLGICLGMQLLCTHSEENDTRGLGVFRALVKRFPEGGKVPHMGWNTIEFGEDSLFETLGGQPHLYFVHGYWAEECEDTIARSEHIVPFSSAMRRENFWGVQFHPEKSARVGARILENFLS